MRKLLHSLFILFLNVFFVVSINAQSVTPGDSSGYSYFKVANAYFQVDPAFGSRISSLKIDGNEMMFVDRSYGAGFLWGATLWYSPGGYPPPAALDQDPYSGGIHGDSITLLSDVDETNGTFLRFRKTFHADLSDTSITVNYTMINAGLSDYSCSAWELTRVPPSGGMAFFPYGEGEITSSGDLASYVEKENGIAWYKYESSHTAAQKFFSDGSEGWSAFLNSDRELYIRKFKDVPYLKQAPGESEIELWLNSSDTYIELEVQSEYKSIAAGDSVVWTSKWYVRDLPSSISTAVGSAGLISYVRDIIKDHVVPVNSIQDLSIDAFTLYPNPVADRLTIESKIDLAKDSYLTVYNLQGQIALMKKLMINRSVIDVSALANGLYIYEIAGTNVQYHRGKIIVKR